MENVSAKTAGGLRRHWKALLWIIGVPSFVDIIKEWARGRIMAWLVAHLGSFGRWLAENPFAFFTLGLFFAMLFLAISVVRTELNPPASVIVDANRRPYVSRPRVRESALIVAAIVVFSVLAVYGALKYWTIVKTSPVPVTVAQQPNHATQKPAKAENSPSANRKNGTSKNTSKDETSHKRPPSVAPNTVIQSPSQPATLNSRSVPTSAPASIIPPDPEKAVEAVNVMRNSLAEVLGKKDTITFLMSWPDDDSSNLAFISQVLSSACRTQPRQCWFAQRANPNNLDYPTIPQPTRRGLTIHGADADSIAVTLGGWFLTYSTSSIPKQLSAYKQPDTKELIWVEIGPGSPWKSH